jgi:hypothetical protein
LLVALAAAALGLGGLALFFGVLLHGNADAPSDLRAQYLRRPGNAPPAVQAGVLAALRDFQQGYAKRDPKDIDPFMSRLFANDSDVLILGTDRSEWARGYSAASDFIRADWLGWGNLRLAVDDSIVSSYGDVAWIATVGTVHFKGYDRPVRLSAVLTRNGNRWLFRQVQFQWEGRAASPSSLLLRR